MKFLRQNVVKEQLKLNPWFTDGIHFRSPDALILLPSRIIVLEAKLTFKVYGDSKLYYEYGPIVSAVFNLPVTLVQVTSWPRKQKPDAELLDDVLALPVGGPFLWHWI